MELQFLGFVIIFFIILVVYELSRYSNAKYLTSGRNVHLITFSNKKWSKSVVDIREGDMVVWKNLDNIRVQVTNNYDTIPNSELLDNYDEYAHIFLKAGKYVFQTPLYRTVGNVTVRVMK